MQLEEELQELAKYKPQQAGSGTITVQAWDRGYLQRKAKAPPPLPGSVNNTVQAWDRESLQRKAKEPQLGGFPSQLLPPPLPPSGRYHCLFLLDAIPAVDRCFTSGEHACVLGVGVMSRWKFVAAE